MTIEHTLYGSLVDRRCFFILSFLKAEKKELIYFQVLYSMRCIDNSDFMAHVLPIFLHFDIIYLTFATDFWHMLLGSLVFFHHLFCGAPRNPQGNFVQRLGAPSPPEVQLLRQVRWKSHGKKIPQNKNTTVFPAAHPTPELCFLKWHFFGGMPRRFEESESFWVRLFQVQPHPAKFTILLMVQKSCTCWGW